MIVSAKRYMTAFAAAALTAVAVSACGGGTTTPPPPPMYVDLDLSHLMSGFATGAGTFQIRAGQHVDRGDVRFRCAAGGEDCTVRVAVDGGTITAMATTAGGMVTAVDASMPPLPGKEAVDLSGVAAGYLADNVMMLEIKAGESEVHGDIRFSCASSGDDCVVMVMLATDGTVTALRSESGGMVTASNASDPNTQRDQRFDTAINAGHSTSVPTLGDDGTPDPSYGYMARTDASVADIAGWTSSVHELETPAMAPAPAMTDTLVIYSNTDFEIAVDFTDEHMFDTNPDGGGVNQSLIVYSGNVSRVSDVSSFPSAPNLLNVNVAMNVGGTGYQGVFDGAAGEYWCNTVGGCVFDTDGDGNLIYVSGDLYFTPAAGAQVDVPDPDYMYFGYWLRESEDDEGDPAFEVAGVYGGPAPSNDSYVVMLEGSATYEGSATGLYVRRWTDANNEVLRRRTGQFTADVELLANFGGADIAAADHYSISGTISNFMDAAGPVDPSSWASDRSSRAIDPSWRLALQRADFSSNSFYNTTEGTGDDGMWYGQFFGDVEVDNDPVALGNQSTLPSGVAGAFDGHFNNGDVIGAYGAERQE